MPLKILELLHVDKPALRIEEHECMYHTPSFALIWAQAVAGCLVELSSAAGITMNEYICLSGPVQNRNQTMHAMNTMTP
jgi:hypothetical protein